MNTANPEHPQQPESPENESSFLPKLEDLIAVTGLFTPSLILEELQDLEKLDEQQEVSKPDID
ncbi:hypothetical protein [Hymenobacter yonginensis]|uniref:Uncharacterized protein n=1 Tax=Hymenobacter yonginensis TaxID=748197 RepID=A0ABY7PT45_9BACT|nr:hypothetical protein [Hymenobacter yonginensis]WBO86079.1 hypothetical protein O9Z63_07440 [Hymenobacter yonginensis]